ncbi:MAG TPA: SEC-C metal-binding domain-containing protein [Bacillales bacterium]|nr:SEC-C metal-binding domain-containing protein [Bacillales bacterium]
MNGKISRNDPCPCGSGKKYKKCCGANEAISITHMIVQEMDDLQKQILQYAFTNYGTEIEDDYEDLQEMLFIDEEQGEQFFEIVHGIWFSLFEQLDDEETIIEKFIASEGAKIKRPKLKQILQSWKNPRAMAGKITTVDHQKLTVEDAFTLEKMEVYMVTDYFPVTEGSFFIGFLLPYDQNFVFFASPFELSSISMDQGVKFIKNSSLEAGYDLPQEYLTDFFIEVLNELPMVGDSMDLDHLDWPAPVYQEVAEIIQEKLLDESLMVKGTGIILWFQFCQKREKRIQNPNIYAAAIHYLVSGMVPTRDRFTQKELGDLYGVSASSISAAYKEIEYVLSDEINDLLRTLYEAPMEVEAPVAPFNQGSMVMERAMQEAIAQLQGQNFDSIDEINQFLNQNLNTPKKSPQGTKERAQDLIYDAFEAVGNQRYKLAEQALKLDPNCVDAYTILAEKAQTIDEASQLYKKGMLIGEKQLGKAFFKKNKGHFWGLIETRPYMRAKLHYAETLRHLGKIKEATKHFEELLELNPNDNQGVRFFLFTAFAEQGDLKAAHGLLQQYEEGTAQNAYNMLLLELLENGFTAKAEKLLSAAKTLNKHVIPYLIGKKRLPDQQSEYYSLGDENEAIIYVSEHLHLWKQIAGFQDWIKKH